LIQTSCACISCNPSSCSSNQRVYLVHPCSGFEVVNVYMAQVLGGSHSSKQPCTPWEELLKSSNQHSGAQHPEETPCMSPPLSDPAPHLSNHQLFHQVALILDAMSPGMSDRKRSLLALKLPGSQPLEPWMLMFFLWRLVFLLSHMDPRRSLRFKGWPITSKILTEPTWSTPASSPRYSQYGFPS